MPKELMSPVLFVPANQNLYQLLREFLDKRVFMAIVKNNREFLRLLTITDIIETLVGETGEQYERGFA